MRFPSKLSVLFLALALSPVMAFAACEKATDPCSPVKEKGAWEKSMALGLNMTSGNSDTLLVTAMGAARRETDQDLMDFGAAVSYGEDDALEESTGSSTTRNDLRANAGYNYKISELVYAGLGSKFLHDEIADVKYRLNLNPTIGYFLLKDADFSLGIEGGPGYTFEKVAEESDDYFSPRIADRFDWVISCTSKLYQSAEVLFDISDSENYLINAEIGVESALSTDLSLVVSLRETYDHQPAEGRDKGDLALISALKVAL